MHIQLSSCVFLPSLVQVKRLVLVNHFLMYFYAFLRSAQIWDCHFSSFAVNNILYYRGTGKGILRRVFAESVTIFVELHKSVKHELYIFTTKSARIAASASVIIIVLVLRQKPEGHVLVEADVEFNVAGVFYGIVYAEYLPPVEQPVVDKVQARLSLV